ISLHLSAQQIPIELRHARCFGFELPYKASFKPLGNSLVGGNRNLAQEHQKGSPLGSLLYRSEFCPHSWRKNPTVSRSHLNISESDLNLRSTTVPRRSRGRPS